VTGRAVEPEQLGTAGDLLGAALAGGAAQRLLRDRAVGVGDDARPAAVEVDIGAMICCSL